MSDVKLAKDHGDEVLEVGAGLFEAERRARAHVDEHPSLPIDPDQVARARLGVLEIVSASAQHLDIDPEDRRRGDYDHLEGAFVTVLARRGSSTFMPPLGRLPARCPSAAALPRAPWACK